MTEQAMPPNMTHFWTPPNSAKIVGMLQHNGNIVVATDYEGIFIVRADATDTDKWTVEKVLFR